ncbi:MAG: LamG domain-containing protein [Planctomycetota bacterium]|jgi:hypothetical protein
MCKRLALLTSFVLALSLVGTNVVSGALVIEVRVSAGSDDAEEAVNSGNQDTYNTSSDLEITDDNVDNGGRQFIGMNFRDVQVPPGAQIKRAYIEFVCDETKDGTADAFVLIWGHLTPNPDGFAAPLTPTEISDRPRTEAKVSWEPEPWTAVGQISQTSDISSIVEELISQDGWAPGNAIEIIIGEDTSKGTYTGSRTAESYNGLPSQAPLLVIELSTKFASSPSPADGAMHEDTWVSLGWEAGETAVTHDVYMSDNFDDVNDGAAAAFQGNQAVPFFTAGFPGFAFPDGLVPGTTYYWRIDEVEASGTTKHEGPIWSFWIPSKTARDPSPRDGAEAADPEVTLSWTPGFGAKLHTVYFGDDFDTVNNAADGVTQGTTTFTPGTLAKDKVYYWRVDEFDPPETHKGEVWSFRTLPDIVITDPDLIGWWKFDNVSGSTVLDWSGYGNDGTTGGDPQLVDGALGLALELDGSDYVSIDGVVDDITSTNITLSAWIKTRHTAEGNVFSCNDSGTGHPFIFGVNNGNVWVEDDASTEFLAVNDDQWHMITYVRNGSTGYIYIDGFQIGTDSASFTFDSVTRWSIGQEWDDGNPSDFYIGLVDDARFFNKSLTQPEVAELMRGDPLVAWSPQPANGTEIDVERAKQPLTWSPGDSAAEHDVYFGTDLADVDLADTSTPDIYRGRQAAASYSPPESLAWGSGPYFWRIDEYSTDGTVTRGSIWSFAVADYLSVDDFEGYSDDEDAGEAIWQNWIDGFGVPANGSQVGNLFPPYAERSIVHGGRQSMPLSYNNTGGVTNSEAVLTLTAPRDWTTHGVGALSLWFIGTSSNAAEPLYVALSNAAGAPAVVVAHDDPAAATTDVWTEWVVPLQAFADRGINLTNVDKIAIGLGSGANVASVGGFGTLYVDDLRLYRLAP